MPQTTQYIREEDMEAWAAIVNKSKWIHDHLSKEVPPMVEAFTIIDKKEQIVEVLKNTASNSFARPQNGLCKLHGTLLDINGKCTQKGHKK